jgi:methyl-accepting chemotaxis protein
LTTLRKILELLTGTRGINLSALSLEEQEIIRKNNLAGLLSLGVVLTNLGAIFSLPWLFLIFNNLKGFELILLYVVLCAIWAAGSWYCARKNLTRLSSGLLIALFISNIPVFYWLMGLPQVMLVSAMLALTVSINFFNLAGSLVVLGGVIATIMGSFLFITNPLFAGMSREIETAFMVALCCLGLPCLLILLIIPAQSRLALIRRQYLQLREAFSELEKRQQMSQEVSRDVLTMSGQLNESAVQWSDGIRQQANSVSQINDFVTLLSSTSANIAEMSEKVNNLVSNVSSESLVIQRTSQKSLGHSQEGLSDVQKTTLVSQEVATLYRQLLDSMQTLQERSLNMRRILNLITTVAGQTHLLALNAAIEAAGASEHGLRFGVIATEVRQLAQQSSQASKEVVGIIEEIEGGIDAALKLATDGCVRADTLHNTAGQTGTVIAEMQAVSELIVKQVNTIRESLEQVRELSAVIRNGTAQQHTASQQILGGIQELSVVAAQSVAGSQMLAGSANNLSQLSENLNSQLNIAS